AAWRQPSRRSPSPSEGGLPSVAARQAHHHDRRDPQSGDPSEQPGQRDHNGRDYPGCRPFARRVSKAPMIAESATGPRLVPSWKDKRPGVVFFTVRATVAILSPYVEPKNDSRPLIFRGVLPS